MPSVQLPVGAVDIANPRDVVKAAKAPQKSGTSSSAGAGTPASSSSASGQRKKNKTPCAEKRKKKQSLGTLLGQLPAASETASAHEGTRGRGTTAHTVGQQLGKPSFLSSSSGSELSSSTSGSSSSSDSDDRQAALKRKKKKSKSKREAKREKARRSKKKREGQANDKKIDPDQVPIQIQDTRNDLERLVDEIIDQAPTLKSMVTFKKGSVPEYIDRIGVTREEAFAAFPDQKPALPLVPGNTRPTILNMPDAAGQGEFLEHSRESMLASALELECRRADLLDYQVKMLRAELVTALKRTSVLATIFKLNIPATEGEDQVRLIAQRDCVQTALGEIDGLGAGKLIKVLPTTGEKKTSKKSRRSRRAKAKADHDDSSSLADSSSELSSASSDED